METVLDSLVVKIRADTQALDQGIAAASANLQGLQGISGQVETTATALHDTALSFTSLLGDTTEAATKRMSTAFERMAKSGKFSFDSLQNSALASLAQIVTSFAGAGLEALFSGGGLLSGILPGRAGGGTVSAGQPYMVGERGAELFVPSTSGRIATAGSFAQGGDRAAGAVNITVNIQSSGTADGMRQSGAQVARAVRRVLSRG
ncbi:phage tail tape measure protein [Govanella unica]|uniref:Uncharacterized protein n=1 Tax=Govanella unica TaxID=2975056 RepID=A0A9X3U012_9PROT|nr:hypothetical protein [Govania unica]MDA5194953.1 hypothetical protein [Govania unica]